MTTLASPQRTRSWRAVASRALAIAVVAVVGALLAATVFLPAALGWIPLTVLTGSMAPAIPPGSQVVVRPLEGREGAAQVRMGDVVAFLPNPDDATPVVHRVIAMRVDDSGGRSFTTKGDANNAPDPRPVTERELRGVVVYHVPWVGQVAQVVPGQAKQIGIYVLAGALLCYAGYQVVRYVAERKQ